MCSLFIPEEDKVVNIACEHLEPVSPEKGDRVSTEGMLWIYRVHVKVYRLLRIGK